MWTNHRTVTRLISGVSIILYIIDQHAYGQNPLDAFSRSFSYVGKVANLLRTCYGFATGKPGIGKGSCREIGVLDFGLSLLQYTECRM